MRKWQNYTILGSVALLAACDGSDSSPTNKDRTAINDQDAESCFMERIDEGYKIICGEDSVGVFLNDSRNEYDEGCTMAPTDNGYKVICGEDSVGVLMNGENGLSGEDGKKGETGEKGDPGESCTVSALPKGYLVSCGDDSIEVVNENIKEKADISFRVIDFNTGLPITSALVLSAGANDSLYTDSLGVLTIKANVLGDYTFIISKKGYTSQVQHITLKESGAGDVARVADQFTDVKLHAAGVTVNGTVLYTDSHSGAVAGASQVKVILQFQDKNMYPAEVSTTTDKLGVYTFENLPENMGYSIYVPQTTIGGSTYASVSSKEVSGLRAGERKDLETIRLSAIGLVPELVKDNLSGIRAQDTVIFQFSTELLEDSIAKSWKVYKGGYISGNYCYDGISVLTNATLKNTTLRIAPIKGTWTDYDSYCVSGTGYSLDGQKIFVAKTFIPGDINTSVASITKLKVKNYYDNYLQLSWQPTGDNIAGYKVYYKTNKVNDFREITNWNSGTLPIDSSVCERTNSYSSCDQYWDISSSYNRVEYNYYWYTRYITHSSTDDDDRDYNGYNDSTSTTYKWLITETQKGTSLNYSSRVPVYRWKKVTTVTCEVTEDEYIAYNGYEGCYAYMNYSRVPDNEEPGSGSTYYTYYWYVDESPVAYDSCEVRSGSYMACPEYDTYSQYGRSYYDIVYNYYIDEVVDSSECSKAGSANYAYETCDQYFAFGKAPDKVVYVYWDKVPTDSVSCTTSGDMRYEPKCDSLIRAFANENYLAAYNAGSTYYYDENNNYVYLSNPYNSKSSDRNYIWYTAQANIKPLSSDSMAFVRAGDVFTEGVTTASFIVLPYITPNGSVITSSVTEADSVKIQKK